MNTLPAPSFRHHYAPGASPRTLLLLHGTGGDEHSLHALGTALDPQAAQLSPRGQVLEHGHPRFFRRLAEGVFDEADLIHRTHALADFVAGRTAQLARDPQQVIAVGYSNGANIAASTLLLRPGVLAGAVLLRPMVPLEPATLPDLAGVPVLILAGQADPMVPLPNVRRLAALLTAAGATVTLHLEPAGHALTQAEVAVAQRWLAALPPG